MFTYCTTEKWHLLRLQLCAVMLFVLGAAWQHCSTTVAWIPHFYNMSLWTMASVKYIYCGGVCYDLHTSTTTHENAAKVLYFGHVIIPLQVPFTFRCKQKH